MLGGGGHVANRRLEGLMVIPIAARRASRFMLRKPESASPTKNGMPSGSLARSSFTFPQRTHHPNRVVLGELAATRW